MRVGECCTLRVGDIDLGRAQIIVRAGNDSYVTGLRERMQQPVSRWASGPAGRTR
jgi:integrase